MYTYLVLPFQGQAKGQLDMKDVLGVAQQLQEVINTSAKAGWEFVEVASVTIAVAPGCPGRLFGASASFVTFDQVVFRKLA